MNSTSYTTLEPTITQEVGLSNQITFTAGQAVSLFSSISFLWTIGIILCVAATGFVWVRGGLFRMEASEAGIRKSNEEFKRGSLGLLGVMGLFLIIYTVNKGLLIGDINLDNLRSGGTSSTQGTVNTGSGGQTGGTGTQPGSANSATEQAARTYLAGLNISINKAACASGQTSNCTNVAGLPQVTLDMLAALRAACSGCDLTLTGGTEPGHASHGVGKRPIDLRITGSLSSFLQQRGSPRDNTHTLWGGYTFWNETAGATSNTTGDHYHVY